MAVADNLPQVGALLLNWLQNDIAALHQHLSNLTPHFFNLQSALEHDAFVSLVQHHGYPTPEQAQKFVEV